MSDWKRLQQAAGPFPPQAYQFVREGLAHTVKSIHGEIGPMSEDESRHVSGQQLCLGLRDYAVKQYGLLARTVLRCVGLEWLCVDRCGADAQDR